MNESSFSEPPISARETDNITAADLKQILEVLDLAARRGAFIAGEFSEIGLLYLKLKRFVDQSAAAASNGSRINSD